MRDTLEVYKLINDVKHKIQEISIDEVDYIQLCETLGRKDYEVIIYLRDRGYINFNAFSNDILIEYRHIGILDESFPIVDGRKTIGIDLDIFGDGKPFVHDILLFGYYFISEIIINDTSEIRTITIESRAPRTNVEYHHGPGLNSDIQRLDDHILNDKEREAKEAYDELLYVAEHGHRRKDND